MATKKTTKAGSAGTEPAASKKATKKAATKTKRTANAAFMRPQVVTDALQAIVGKKPLARSVLTKKVWDYIKANGCQDAVNRWMINPKLLLIPVIGDQPVSMFQLTKLISKHILGAVEEKSKVESQKSE